jgi:uncharacterized protein (TIGR00661 family)
MARILYGVAGEGAGHAMQSVAMCSELQKMGHEIEFITGGRSTQMIMREMPGSTVHVAPVPMFTRNRDGSINKIASAINYVRGSSQRADFARGFTSSNDKFDAVISDYEPISAIASKILDVPLVSVDSMHYYCATPILSKSIDSTATAILVRASCASIYGKTDASIISHFDVRRLENQKCGIAVGPVIRERMQLERSSTGGHVLA